jgi:hypothetical protein
MSPLNPIGEGYTGFKITCDKCGSSECAFKSDMGFSPESGGWGGISIVCTKCNNSVEIYENW